MSSENDFDQKSAIENFLAINSKLNSYLYDLNEEFNEDFDENYNNEKGEIDIENQKFSASEILFYLKREVYNDALNEWESNQSLMLDDEFAELLDLNSNHDRIDDLIHLIRNKRAIPFVGAGMTVDCEMPTWTNFLLDLAREQQLDEGNISQMLSDGKYDECADILIRKMQDIQFNEKYRHKFTLRGPVKGSITYLPILFQNGVITTNFDKVLESAYGSVVPVKEGVNSDWVADIKRGKNQIYKIHGTMEGIANRVLTKAEYDSRYGSADINFDLDLTKFLKTSTEVASFFFIGCSLTVDRVIQVLEKLKTEFNSSTHHYAFLQKPHDEKLLIDRQNRLASVNILPIWYPEKDYGKVELLLRYMKFKIEGRI